MEKEGSGERLRSSQHPHECCPARTTHRSDRSILTWQNIHRSPTEANIHTCIQMHTPTRRKANHNTSWCSLSLSVSKNIHCILKQRGVKSSTVCVLDSVTYRRCVCIRGWAAVASASLVAKCASLPSCT